MWTKPSFAVRFVAFAAAFFFAAVWIAQPARAVTQTGWPRTYQANGAKIVVYQPQVNDWPNYTLLHGLAAVQVTPTGASTGIYGVVNFQAYTAADFNTGIVTLQQLHITTTNFPNVPQAEATKLDGIVREIPLTNSTVPLATVLASLDASKALPQSAPVSVTPPTIYYTQKNAMLVVFDRDPIWAPIEGTGLKFAVNTNWTVIQDGATYYLLATDHWLSATAYTGPWTAATAPASFAGLPSTANWTEARTYLNAPALAADAVPQVFVSTQPAELIFVAGSPKLVGITGTKLEYVSNTGSNLFYFAPTKVWYVLLSGRWYAATSLSGPWTYASPSLPPDFAKIPLNSARGSVLVSVPGTPEAQYVGASMAAPQIASVNPSAAKPAIAYGGTPQFAPIAGTPLQYATNTANDVIMVNANSYYACVSGVWFTATTPNGPWSVATYVPKVIYTIPPSSPLYPDTYVFVYNNQGQPQYGPPPAPATSSPDTTVLVGYTAGYLGAYWYNNAWVYGTGYYYPGYYYPAVVPIYYPYAWTWTGGAVYTGGSYYNPTTGYYGNQASVYGPYGGATAKSAYNPTTGTYARGAAVYGPNGEAAAGSFYNPRYGVSGSTVQARTPYGSWGQSAVTTKNGTTYTGHASNANGSAAAASGPHGNTAVAKSNSTGDVYAGHDGNVYRNQDGTWQKSTGNGTWSNVQTPSSSRSTTSTASTAQARAPVNSASSYRPPSGGDSSLNRDYGARQSAGGFGGFSGSRGGGGFGGRR